MKKIAQFARSAAKFGKRNVAKVAFGLAVATAGTSQALAAGEPIDLTATATSINGWASTAAGLGVTVFGIMTGIGLMKAAFKKVAS